MMSVDCVAEFSAAARVFIVGQKEATRLLFGVVQRPCLEALLSIQWHYPTPLSSFLQRAF
jgi:hypothetical protein